MGKLGALGMPEEFFPKEFSLKTMQNYAFPVKLPRDRAENAIFFYLKNCLDRVFADVGEDFHKFLLISSM